MRNNFDWPDGFSLVKIYPLIVWLGFMFFTVPLPGHPTPLQATKPGYPSSLPGHPASFPSLTPRPPSLIPRPHSQPIPRPPSLIPTPHSQAIQFLPHNSTAEWEKGFFSSREEWENKSVGTRVWEQGDRNEATILALGMLLEHTNWHTYLQIP